MRYVDIDTARVIISAPNRQLPEVLPFLKRALPLGEIEFNDLAQTCSQTMAGLVRVMTAVCGRTSKYGFTRQEAGSLILNKIYT